MALEINLVPDIKNEMIRTLKLRNFIFFLCIIVASASVAIVFIFGIIVGGQSLAIKNKQNLLDNLSGKLNSYSDLGEFLTIKDQVGSIASITSDKKVASRTFNILSALIPTGPDTIQISELRIDLAGEEPIFTLEAQANAGQPPYIDYSVLDSFKKSMAYMRYDYGNYVDKGGNTIPAYCMIEKNSNGAYFSDPEKGMYAYWTIMADGCNNNLSQNDQEAIKDTQENNENTDASSEPSRFGGYRLEDYAGMKVVRIWRTPQFDDWYKRSYLDINGTISNIEHFESSCIEYSGEENSDSNAKLKWSETNESCLLVPAGDDGISIAESSGGRNAAEELVVRFTASISLSPEVYNFNNAHMIALSPSKRLNVTDSYVQIQSIFSEQVKRCQEDDKDCIANEERR